MNRQRLTAALTMVAHGFKITDGKGHFIGYRSGRCFGVGHRPFELSKDGLVAFHDFLKSKKSAAEAKLQEYKSGKTVEIHQQIRTLVDGRYVTSMRTVSLGDANFWTVLHYETLSTQGVIHTLTSAIARHEFLLRTWTRRDLK